MKKYSELISAVAGIIMSLISICFLVWFFFVK